MPAPKNITELRSFLDAVNYYSKFIRKMRQLKAPLEAPLKRDSDWNWTKSCEEAFQQFKETLSSDLMLTHYKSSNQVGCRCLQFGHWSLHLPRIF